MLADKFALSCTEPVSSHCYRGLLATSKQREIWEGWLVSSLFGYYKSQNVLPMTTPNGMLPSLLDYLW